MRMIFLKQLFYFTIDPFSMRAPEPERVYLIRPEERIAKERGSGDEKLTQCIASGMDGKFWNPAVYAQKSRSKYHFPQISKIIQVAITTEAMNAFSIQCLFNNENKKQVIWTEASQDCLKVELLIKW